MKKIITLSGHKDCGKYALAEKWGRNENVGFIQPFTDNPKRRFDDFPYLPSKKLLAKIGSEPLIAMTEFKDFTYVYFPSQLNNDFNVIIADDTIMNCIRDNYEDVVTVWVENPAAEESDRVGKYKKESYDYVFNYGIDDPDEFLEQLAFDVELVQTF